MFDREGDCRIEVLWNNAERVRRNGLAGESAWKCEERSVKLLAGETAMVCSRSCSSCACANLGDATWRGVSSPLYVVAKMLSLSDSDSIA